MHALQSFAQFLERLGVAGIPKRGFLEAGRGRTVIALHHILLPDVHVRRRLQRIQRILLGLERFVFFGQILRARRRRRRQLRLRAEKKVEKDRGKEGACHN